MYILYNIHTTSLWKCDVTQSQTDFFQFRSVQISQIKRTIKSDPRTIKSDLWTIKSDFRTIKSDLRTIKSDLGCKNEQLSQICEQLSQISEQLSQIYRSSSHSPASISLFSESNRSASSSIGSFFCSFCSNAIKSPKFKSGFSTRSRADFL